MLSGRELESALTKDGVDTSVLVKALSIMIHVWSESPLSAVQNCENTKAAWDKTASKLCRKTMISKLSI